jgi:hypothetical protein
MTERRSTAGAHFSKCARARSAFTITNIQLSAMDVLVLTTMKNAAKCDTKSELQNPVNLYVFERMLRFRVLLEACLFECLFSPLAVSLRSNAQARLADFGRRTFRSASIQVERRRELVPFTRPLCFRSTDVVRSSDLNKSASRSRRTRVSSVSSVPLRCLLRRTQREHPTFGPQIRQEDPLNLSI